MILKKGISLAELLDVIPIDVGIQVSIERRDGEMEIIIYHAGEKVTEENFPFKAESILVESISVHPCNDLIILGRVL